MSKKHIVLVDDDPMIRMLVQEYLKAFGFEVSAFDSGADALSALSKTVPDLLVLDLQMPGMNGLEVLEKVRSDPRTEPVPVLMLSANAGEAQAMPGIMADQYLEKPFQMKAFLEAVESTQRAQSKD